MVWSQDPIKCRIRTCDHVWRGGSLQVHIGYTTYTIIPPGSFGWDVSLTTLSSDSLYCEVLQVSNSVRNFRIRDLARLQLLCGTCLFMLGSKASGSINYVILRNVPVAICWSMSLDQTHPLDIQKHTDFSSSLPAMQTTLSTTVPSKTEGHASDGPRQVHVLLPLADVRSVVHNELCTLHQDLRG